MIDCEKEDILFMSMDNHFVVVKKMLIDNSFVLKKY